MKTFKIGDRSIGGKASCFIIAEVAQAHDGSLGTAHAFIDAAADAGVDAVKFQTHIAHAESTPSEPWRIRFSKQDTSRYDYWKRMEFTPDQWLGLKKHCDERGLIFLSSPFSQESIDLLFNLDIQAWKVASGEVNNLPMVQRLVETGLPILFSSGMSYLRELEASVALCEAANVNYGLFQCTTAYPCPPEKIGLNVMEELRSHFSCPVGLSDHSGEVYPALAAVALGCQILEVHITFNKKMFGPDVPASLDLEQLEAMVFGVRYIEKMQTNPINKQAAVDASVPMRSLFLKSLVARRDLKVGETLQVSDIACKKPGTGIPPEEIDAYIGRTLVRDVPTDTLFAEEDFA